MEKEFIPYRLALRIKKLGFNEPCLAYYDEFNNNKVCYGYSNNTNKAPTFSQVFRFIRDKYNLIHVVEYYDGRYKWYIVRWKLGREECICTYEDKFLMAFENYEELEIHCLKKMLNFIVYGKK